MKKHKESIYTEKVLAEEERKILTQFKRAREMEGVDGAEAMIQWLRATELHFKRWDHHY